MDRNDTSRTPVMCQTDWASLMLALQWIYEGPVPPDGAGPRTNPDLSAWLLLAGTVTVRPETGNAATAGPGDWMFLPAGHRRQNFSPDARLLSFCWKARWPDGRHLYDHGLPLTFPAADRPALEDNARKLLAFSRRYLESDPLPSYRLRALARVDGETFLKGEMLLMAWLREVMAALSERDVFPSLHLIPDERVLRALEQLEFPPLVRVPKVEDIARDVGLSVSQLNRLFSRHMGHSPTAHLHARRLSEVRHLLQSGDMPVKEVAFHAGFSSQSAFTHWFKKHTGLNPRQFAKQPAPNL